MKRDAQASTAHAPTQAPSPDGARAREGPSLQPGNIRPPTLMALPSFLAGNVSRVGTRMLMRTLKHQGLRLSHHAVLAALHDFGPMAQHELADRLDVDRSQVVGFVDRLEQKGFVTRARDKRDRRRVLVSLTGEGRRAERRITAAARSSQTALLGALTPSEQTQLLELLRRVLDAHDESRLGLTAY